MKDGQDEGWKGWGCGVVSVASIQEEEGPGQTRDVMQITSFVDGASLFEELKDSSWD